MTKHAWKWSLVLAAVWALSGWAEDGEEHWKGSVNLGGSMTRGNSKTAQGNAALVLEGELDGLGALRFTAEGNYGESETDGERTTTVENARAGLKARKDLHKRVFVAANAAVRYDELARIDYRYTVGPSLGVFLVKKDRVKLELETGAVHIWEKTDGQRDDYTAYRAAERLDIALSDTAKFWQTAEYIPQANDFDDYLLVVEAGVEAAVNSRLSLRLVWQSQYDSRPAEDVKKHDQTLIAGIGIKL